MFYNQNFDNNYNFNSRNNNFEKDENRDCKKGYCNVKVIQECCYPSYWDYNENKKDDKRCNCNNQENKNYYNNDFSYNNYDRKENYNNDFGNDRKENYREEKCCYKHEEMKEEHNYSCNKEDKWEYKNTCSCQHRENENRDIRCCRQNRCCGICSLFRRW